MDSILAENLAGGTEDGQNGLNQNTELDPPRRNEISGGGESFLAPRYDQLSASSKDTNDHLSQSGFSGHVRDKRASGGNQDEAGRDYKGNRMPESSGNGSFQRNAHVVPESKQPLLSTSSSSHAQDLETSPKDLNSDPVSYSSRGSLPNGKTNSHTINNGTYLNFTRPEVSVLNGIEGSRGDAYQGSATDINKKQSVSLNVEESIPMSPPSSATLNNNNSNSNNKSWPHENTRGIIDSLSTSNTVSQCDRRNCDTRTPNGISKPEKDVTDRYPSTNSNVDGSGSNHNDGSLSLNAPFYPNLFDDRTKLDSTDNASNKNINHLERFRNGSPVAEEQFSTPSLSAAAGNGLSLLSNPHWSQHGRFASSTTSAPPENETTTTTPPFKGVSSTSSSNGGRSPTLTSPEQVDGSCSPIRNQCPISPLAPNTAHLAKNANTRCKSDERILSPEESHQKPNSLPVGPTLHRINDEQENNNSPNFSQDLKPSEQLQQQHSQFEHLYGEYYPYKHQPHGENSLHGQPTSLPSEKKPAKELHSPPGISSQIATGKRTNKDIDTGADRQHTSFCGLASQHIDDAFSQNDNQNSAELIPLSDQLRGSPETTPATNNAVEGQIKRISDLEAEQTANLKSNNTTTNLKADHSTPLSTASLTSARGQFNLSTSSPSLDARHLVLESQTQSRLAGERFVPGSGVDAKKPVENGDSTLAKSNDEENSDDEDEKGDNVTDSVDSFPSDYENSTFGNRSVELEPLILSDVYLNHRKLDNMAHPVLESYKINSDDHLNDAGNRVVNGNVHSVEGSGIPNQESKAKYLESQSQSNGVVSKAGDSFQLTDTNSYHGKNGDGDENDDIDDGGPCGWGPIHFGCCQRFRSPRWFLLIITLCGACQGMAVNGFVNTVISTIEKRFEITSTESGLIASCYDIMFVLLVIPVSYFGGHGNKPRYLGIGIFILGLGSFVFSLPHFISDNYDVGDAQDTVCKVNRTLPTSCTTGSADLSNYKYFFFLGQLLHGAGATALYTLGVVYMDENVSQRSSSLYNGIFYTGAIIGPAVGYILGSEFLKIYTDPDVDPDSLGLDVNNPKWVGAWWIGFIINGTFAFLLSIPLLAFPPSLPGSKKYAIDRGKESHAQKGVDKTGQHKGIKDILLSIKLLLTNLPFMFINIAAAADGILVGGFSTFMPKFIEYQFGVSSATAALYVGLAVVPAGGGATFLGGFLVTFFNLKVRGILRLCITSAVLLLLLIFALLLNCETGKFAGVNTYYKSDRQVSTNITEDMLINSCNQDCNCQEEDYFPMCGRDGLLYFSPCYAGCAKVVDEGSSKYYYNCSCLDYNYTISNWAENHAYEGEFGKCDSQCQLLTPFMLLFGVLIVLMFITSMPSLTATLRCVPDHLRAFGLGIQWIVARCLGSIPGPILFGKMFDLACLLWQKRCNGSGSCFFYDNHDMRVNLLSVTVVFGFIAALAFFLANWLYKAKPADDTVHIEFKRNQDSFRVSQNTILPDTPTTPNGTSGQALP